MTDFRSAVAVVVVQWFMKPGREGDFLRDRKAVRRAAGFLGEVLFRAVVDTDDPADDNPVVYFNMGYWRTREDFYRKLRQLSRQGQAAMNDYDAIPRRRHWLTPAG